MVHSLVRPVLIAALMIAPSAWSEKLTAPVDARARVDKIFERYNRTDGPGCVAGASIDGTFVLANAYGMADLEHGIALAPESIL